MDKKRSVAFEIITCLQYAGLNPGFSCSQLIQKEDLVDFVKEILENPQTSRSLKDKIGCRSLNVKPTPKAKFLQKALKKLESVG